jgi:hypothetical protein
MDNVELVVLTAHQTPFTTRSDFARENAEAIAEACYEGQITTYSHSLNDYSNVWYITSIGMRLLECIS